jgi:hypothetical protein
MKQQRMKIYIMLLSAALMAACDNQNSATSQPDPIIPTQVAKPEAPAETAKVQAIVDKERDVIELEWDALIPADWRLDKLMEEYDADNLADDDPRAKELMEKMKQFWREAPVVNDYDGKKIKLPGFVVPLEMNATDIQEFLLVPYYGACIHTPPPPSNQTVYVVTEEEKPYQGELFDTVWVTGTLRVEKLSSELGDAGYRVDALQVEPYE